MTCKVLGARRVLLMSTSDCSALRKVSRTVSTYYPMPVRTRGFREGCNLNLGVFHVNRLGNGENKF